MSATGFAAADEARPELAAHAVRIALDRAGASVAHGIVLLLTPHFARAPQAAVTAAARAGHCLQVAGGTTPGVFTEQAWTLDQPAAAALVLTDGIALGPPDADSPRLSLAMPDALDAAWLDVGQPRFGSLATGNEHHAIGAVWHHGKWQVEGRIDAALTGANVELAVSRGMQAISGAHEVADVDGYEVLLLDDEPPLPALLASLPPELRDAGRLWGLPSGLLFAALIDGDATVEQALADGRYVLAPIVGANASEGTVTLGASASPGMRLFWALRHPAAAAGEMQRGIARIDERHDRRPEFALMFSCIGRGPWFHGGTDRDLAALLERHPGLPVLGAYCGGEIAPLPGGNAILSYSALAALAYR